MFCYARILIPKKSMQEEEEIQGNFEKYVC